MLSQLISEHSANVNEATETIVDQQELVVISCIQLTTARLQLIRPFQVVTCFCSSPASVIGQAIIGTARV